MKLNPKGQFAPTVENLSEILSQYSRSLKSFELARSGIENCTVFVDTDGGRFVLRVYRQSNKTEDDIQLEAEFVDYLHGQDIPVAVPIKSQAGLSVTKVSINQKDWFVILMPEMPGAHGESYTPELMTTLAQLQAKMHLAATTFKHETKPAQTYNELREGFFIKQITNLGQLDEQTSAFVDRAAAYSVQLSDTLPSGYCHLDYDNGNVLSDGNQVTAVLDFDDLSFTPFVHCLAYTIWDIVFEKGIGAIQAYCMEYEKVRPLTDHERAMLIPIILFRHYVIGCKDIVDEQMSSTTLARYLEIENVLLSEGNLR